MYCSSAVKAIPCSLPGSFVGGFGSQVILPLAHTIDLDEVRFLNCPLDCIFRLCICIFVCNSTCYFFIDTVLGGT